MPNGPTSVPIQTFEIMYSSNKWARRIVCYNNNKSVGQFAFMPAGTTLPADLATGEFCLYYHVEDFANVIYALKNGKNPFVSLIPGGESTLISGGVQVGM